MKIIKIIILITIPLLVTGSGCKSKRSSREYKGQLMTLDSSIASGKNMVLVRPGDTLRPTETIKDIKELPNIMLLDLDTVQKTSSREIKYLKKGEPVHPAE